MSGHSKWANIKRKKEKTDSARAKVFTKIGREIMVAAREGGPDPANNSRLAALIAKAKALLMERNNMTEAEAHRYIQKCSMDSGTNLVETAQMVISLIHV